MSKLDEKVKELESNGKKVLTLIIKQKYFDEILKGTKKEEVREIKPTTYRRYIELDADGNDLVDEDDNAIPLHYDYMHLLVGYNKLRDEAIVEVKGARCECIYAPVWDFAKVPILDEDGNQKVDENGKLMYEIAKDKKGNPMYEQKVDENGKFLTNPDGTQVDDLERPLYIIARDEDGEPLVEPVMIQETDDDGNPLFEEDGTPKMVQKWDKQWYVDGNQWWVVQTVTYSLGEVVEISRK